MTKLATTPTTELEAVNEMLRTIGESPVSSLSGDVGVDVVTAIQTLSTMSRAIQTRGWLFNTEHEYPLMPDVQGNIGAPANALRVNAAADGIVDPVWRGSKMYDRKNHTSVFSEKLEATVVFLLAFDELPETARRYVTVAACRKFQDESLGSTELHRFTKQDELEAMLELIDDQTDDENLNIFDNFGRL